MSEKQFQSSLTVHEVIMLISRRACLICQDNLDKSIGKYGWHIPLCKKHRFEFLDLDRQNKLSRMVPNKSKINGLEGIEERLNWCEEYIKILLAHKDRQEKYMDALVEALKELEKEVQE